MTTETCEMNDQATQTEAAETLATPKAVVWKRHYIEAEYRPDQKAVRLELTNWTESIDAAPVAELRRELIETPLRAAVRHVLTGSERRADYRKLSREKTVIQQRRRVAAAAVRRLTAERAFRLEAQEEDFTQAVVLLDEQIAQQQQAADRAEAELRLIEPIADQAYRKALDEVDAAANAGGPLLVAQVRQRVEAIKGELFELLRPRLDELAQMLSILDMDRYEFERVARPIVFESDPESN